jgi:hypothetical protein
MQRCQRIRRILAAVAAPLLHGSRTGRAAAGGDAIWRLGFGSTCFVLLEFIFLGGPVSQVADGPPGMSESGTCGEACRVDPWPSPMTAGAAPVGSIAPRGLSPPGASRARHRAGADAAARLEARSARSLQERDV